MPVLTQQQRATLETAVKHGRKVAEQGAYNALQAMAVDHPEPFAHMSSDQRILRNLLRSKARLLGDKLEATGRQQINKLSYELAYETWHKMLFAQFLEANQLLMHPDGVAVSFADVEELYKEEGFADKWDAAASYASHMLPAIFRPEDPLMKVPYSTNDRIALEEIIDSLETSLFTFDDALGWVYQFWQSEAKAAINASGDKIDGDKLPAVTQLFTEPYMVHFLIDNTLGAWWVSRHPRVTPPIKFEYLRLLEDGAPAAGKFEGWPDKTSEVTSLDPCMGSGHFVASLFTVFVALRMYEEGLSKEEATDKVIAENLHGLELDPRCTQLAAFNLALTAWKFCGHYKELPEMNLACSGIAPKGKLEDWVKLVGKVERAEDKTRMENGMRMLYAHFQLAPELGSLLDPTTIKADAFTASFEELEPVLRRALENEADEEQVERGVMAAGIAKAGQLLSKKYTLQITNVPYLSIGKQENILADYCKDNYSNSNGDLATVFLDRMLKQTVVGGISSCVTLQNWLFLKNFRRLRENLLKSKRIKFIARLGARCFQTPMWDFNVMLIGVQQHKPDDNDQVLGIDVSIMPSPAEKDHELKSDKHIFINQLKQLNNPISVITFNLLDTNSLLHKYAEVYYGLKPGQTVRVTRNFWEVESLFSDEWSLMESSPKNGYYSGKSEIIYSVLQFKKQNIREVGLSGIEAWEKSGFVISKMNTLPVSIYYGKCFDDNTYAIIPKNSKNITAIGAFLFTDEFNKAVRNINQKLAVDTRSMVNIPFDIDYWQKVGAEKYPNGLPKPYSEDPSQWLFHGNPIKSDNALQVALARFLGYHWPAESNTEMELSEEARELIASVKMFDELSDSDGILCIPSVNMEHAGADRLRDYLQTIWGSEWTNQTISQLLQKEDARSNNLEEWLRNEFFSQHCKVFQNRPFIWHIWDGRKDGFSTLVNYHKLNKDNLSKLIYTYLGDWIRMCEAKKRDGESGAEGLLSAARDLKVRLEAILEGEAPYDIFVRWKSLEQQPIGWDPDLNDGVRLNIRPFMEAKALRKLPNIKWGVDRGKNPPGSPWGEIRDNDRHLTLEEKRKASGINQ